MAFSLGGFFGGKKSETTDEQKSYQQKTTAPSEFAKAPEFEETVGARGAWWDKLQQFGDDPYYGAIQPDWGAIWEEAQKKVSQYFWGSATQPGVASKVRASAARRNVSEGPALENALTRMSAEEGRMLTDVAVQQATQKAQLANQGKQDYLQSLQGLSNQRVPGEFFTPWENINKQQYGQTQSSGSNWGVNGNFSGKGGK